MTDDPHRGSEEVWLGPALEVAESAVVLIHGRGDSSRGILPLAAELEAPHTAFLAPQAVSFSWYPYSFKSEVELNEPWLSSALDRVEAAVSAVGTVIPEERVVLMGFFQGACLALEFAARNTRRYGGVVAFSGGLIGPDGTPRDYPGSLGEYARLPGLQRRRRAHPGGPCPRIRARHGWSGWRGRGADLRRYGAHDQRGRNRLGQRTPHVHQR